MAAIRKPPAEIIRNALNPVVAAMHSGRLMAADPDSFSGRPMAAA
jgi:hypothetical protein